MSGESKEKQKSYLWAAAVLVLIGIVGIQAYNTHQLSKQLDRLISREERFKSLLAQQQEQAGSEEVAQASGQNPQSQQPGPGGLRGRLQGRHAPSAPGLPPGAGPQGYIDDDWNPFEEMSRMRAEMDQMFGNAFSRFHSSSKFSSMLQGSRFSPHVDFGEDGDKYVIKVDLPGVDAKSIDVKVEKGMLKINAKTEQTSDESAPDDDTFIRKERMVGTFSRALSLPGPVNEKKIQTDYNGGVLTVTLPKAEATEEGPEAPVAPGELS